MNNNQNLFSLNIPGSDKPRLVVLGGGFAGINLVKKIRDKFQVVLLDRHNYHTFQPLLYQVATAGLEADSVAGPLRKMINRKDDVYFRMLSAESVSPGKKTVSTRVGKINYDYLVIATGAKMNFFNNESIEKHALPLKKLGDALNLRNHIFQNFEKLELSGNDKIKSSLMNIVVVGAGPTGVELAGALAELKRHVLPKDFPDLNIDHIRIYLVEALNTVLSGMSEESAWNAKRYLDKLGVEVLLGIKTESYDGQILKLDNGGVIETNTLIWAAGVKANVIEGFSNNSTFHGKLRVNEFNQVVINTEKDEYYKEIFAIGDVAHLETSEYEKGLPGVAQAAIQQGRHLAANLGRISDGKPLVPFKYKNKGVITTIGRNRAVADLPNKVKLSGFTGWIVGMIVHLIFLVDFRNKLVALISWVWNYFTYDYGTRLIIRPGEHIGSSLSRDIQDEISKSKK